MSDQQRILGMSGRALDGLGVALVAAAIAWTFVASGASGGSPGPVAGLLGVTACALALGRVAGLLGRWLVPAAVVAVAATVAMVSPDTLSRSPLQGPFGYVNAAGAFFVQASLAGLMLAAATRAWPARIVGVLAAVVFAAIPFLRGSLAAAALIAFLPAAVLLARGARMVRAAVVACAGLFVLALTATVVVGALHQAGRGAGPLDGLVDRTLSERRAALWHDAIEIMRDEPVTGVGPGRFALVAPTAIGDRDARWGHNELLQQGAEQGLVGFALLLLVFLWGFARLWVSPSRDSVTALGAVALAALGIQASIDYVLHFPAVPIVAAVLVGVAQSSGQPSAHSLGSEDDELQLARP